MQMIHTQYQQPYSEVNALSTLLQYPLANAGCCKVRFKAFDILQEECFLATVKMLGFQAEDDLKLRRSVKAYSPTPRKSV
jgi:hypothetical protein